MNDLQELPRCPVCQARFRVAQACSRCGADLEPLMFLATQAHRLREAARQALLAGEPKRSQVLASRAETVCSTRAGKDLLLLSRFLLSAGGTGHGRSQPDPRQMSFGF